MVLKDEGYLQRGPGLCPAPAGGFIAPRKLEHAWPLQTAAADPVSNFQYYFAVSLSNAAWRAEPALWEHQFGSPGCPAQFLSKNQMVHLVTGAQGPPALSVKLCHLYLCVCLSVPIPGTGLQDLCSGFSLAKQEKYQTGHICKLVQLVECAD